MSKIKGGFYIKARCIQESDIATAPPHVREIWDWFIMKANHKDHKNLKRGQLLTSYRQILDGLCWYVGYRKCSYSKGQCETATKYLTKREMITTTKTTRGMIVTVLNYDKFQDPKNYENRIETENEPTRDIQCHDTINKNVNNKYSPNSDEFRLSQYLYKHMLRNNPKTKKPNFETWSKIFDYIIRIDKRPVQEIRAVIEWCQKDKFWFKTILSPEKLRKQYDMLYLQMEAPEPKKEIISIPIPD